MIIAMLNRLWMVRRIFARTLYALSLAAMLGPLASTWAESPSAAQELSDPLVFIKAFDGDSLLLKNSRGKTVQVRLVGIDAPEKNQAHGQAARERLESLLNAEEIEAKAVKRDGHGRWIAQLSVGGKDIGQTMILEGHAWYFRRYRTDLTVSARSRYEEAEAVAREERRGLWASDEEPIPPWRYREKRR